MIRTATLIAPRPLMAGDLVIDPQTGTAGFAKSATAAGAVAEISTGQGFVLTVADAAGAAAPGVPVYLVNGVPCFARGRPDDPQCAEVVALMGRDAEAGTARVMVRLAG